MIGTIARSLAAAVTVALIANAGPVQAQTYPTRPVRLVVPFGPGGVADITARLVTEKMTAAMGQQVIVDNSLGQAGRLYAVVAQQRHGHQRLAVQDNPV
jgi:tripartite-type tricarboxylate transporter receptor subunit TctC